LTASVTLWEERIVYRGLWAALIGVVAIAAIAMATGCGDSEDSAASLSKAEYIEKGNAICKKGVEAGNAATAAALDEKAEKEAGYKLSKAEQESLVVDTSLPPIQTTVDELAELGVPEGDEDVVSSFIDGYEEGIGEVEDDPGSALKNPDPLDQPNKEAVDYGLDECAGLS
jgi:hypothetical protein